MTGKPVNLALSRRTSNLVIPTSIGKVVLKRYRDHLQPEGIQYIHSILSRLSELSFPSLKMIATPDGADFVSLSNGRYAVFEYISGSNHSLDFIHPSDRRRLVEQSGSILAAFHQSLKDFQPSGAHHLGFVSHTGGWQRDAGWFASKARELVQKSSAISNDEDKKIVDFLIPRVDEILNKYTRLDDALQNVPLFRTIIHGDFGLHNLIFAKDGRIVLTDYETARLEWRLADLVSTLSRSRSKNAMYHFGTARDFLKGYFSVQPVPAEEWQYLPDVWMFYKLRSVFVSWNSHFERGGGKLASALDAYHQAKWVQDNAGILLKLRDI
jgi:Ser/Thr protein kinase RdoA (MazF antagonist)